MFESYLWIESQADGTHLVGLADNGREKFGHVKFIDLPTVGSQIKEAQKLFDIEAEKAVQEVTSPISGEVVAINDKLDDHPENLDEPEHSKNWIVRLK